jgi:GT2 family glycosyltransferase
VEVIFVDSASTDRSVDIATQFPVRILQLKPNWPLCVAAGRYTGFRHARGEYTFFLDGDAEVEPDWLIRAIDFMDRHPEYGGVAGVLDEKYVDSNGVDRGGRQNVRRQDLSRELINCKTLGGIALFRRRALEKAGTINPHLPTAEDHELCMRIRNSGFQLARIPGRMAVKYTEKRDTLREILRRSRTKMYDYGAVIRYSAEYGSGIQFCFDAISYIVTFAATLLIFLLAVPLALYFDFVWTLALSVVLLCLAVVIKKRSFRLAFLSIAGRSVSTFRTVISFLQTTPKPIEAYPTDVIQVR